MGRELWQVGLLSLRVELEGACNLAFATVSLAGISPVTQRECHIGERYSNLDRVKRIQARAIVDELNRTFEGIECYELGSLLDRWRRLEYAAGASALFNVHGFLSTPVDALAIRLGSGSVIHSNCYLQQSGRSAAAYVQDWAAVVHESACALVACREALASL